MSESLAGKYKIKGRAFSMGRRYEPGSVVMLSHEDAKTMLAHKLAERVVEPEAAVEPEPPAPPAPETNPNPNNPTKIKR